MFKFGGNFLEISLVSLYIEKLEKIPQHKIF